MKLPKELETALNQIDTKLVDLMETTPAEKPGDVGFPVFALAKEMGKNPVEIANEIVDKIGEMDCLEKIEAVGPYVNITFSDKGWSEFVNMIESGEVNKIGEKKTIVCDYGGENVAKPLSVGHLRSNIIGQAFVNCAKELGYKTISDNHLGDWGTQFGKLAVAIEKWGDWEIIKKDPINELVKLYQHFHQEAENNPELEVQAREEFKKLSEGDDERLEEWEMICKWTKENLEKIHKRIGVSFDYELGESFYRGEKMRDAVEECKKAGLTTENEDGSLAIIPPEELNLPSFLIQKSDGATLYHTSDLATIRYRLDEWSPDRIVYFVAEPQSLHFRQLFWLADKLGWVGDVSLEHASFGLVRLPEGKMSTRGGNVIQLEELLEEATKRAYEILEEKNPDIGKSEWNNLAEQIGVGAVMYADLSKDRTKQVIFEWDTALSFNGQSAPYIQYTHARACSILRKAEINPDFIKITEQAEKDLVLMINKFEEVLINVVNESKPSYLAQWIYELALQFNKFYTTLPVIKAEEDVQKTRLALTKITKDMIKKSMEMLGISVPDKM